MPASITPKKHADHAAAGDCVQNTVDRKLTACKELSPDQLKPGVSAADLDFSTTAELTPLDGLIGQARAEEALDFGLKVRMKGYNIYMAGPSGTGKTTYAKRMAARRAETEPVPPDWCYVMNFRDEKRPTALSFPAGKGRVFRKDMENLVSLLRSELQKAFMSEEYVTRKGAISKEISAQKNALLEQINQVGSKYGFQAKLTDQGLSLSPVIDGKVLSDEDAENLTEVQLEALESNSVLFSEDASPMLRDLDAIERESDDRLDQLDNDTGLHAMKRHIEKMRKKYAYSKKVGEYLSGVQADIMDHLDDFLDNGDPGPQGQLAALLSAQASRNDPSSRYKVNLVVDHSDDKGAPVVVSFSPTIQDLSGEVEASTEAGGNTISTDYMGIKAGQLHKANGGYLLVQAYDILTSDTWEILRRVMKTSEINIGPVSSNSTSQAMPFLKPEPIPANLKIIMIGNGSYYELMMAGDEEFGKFFKVRVDFDYEMPSTKENRKKVAEFIKSFSTREGTPDLDAAAVARVLEYSARCAERQDRLSTRFNVVADILTEASAWAETDKVSLITEGYVRKAIERREERFRQYQEKLAEAVDEDVIMIATQGAEIGQINALAVLDTGDYAFGIPSRITATTYVGQNGIVNIEKEAELSGQTHNKGVQIITGYLGQTYAQKFPLSLSCRICFEQNYSGIDGDSASSTELYAILSSLADLPIRQDLAVTGSVNQRGQIQAIGGVNYKIEGFFDLCKRRGLTGSQGVLIPVSNVRDLVLKDEVVEAVRDGLFHIYPVTTIDQGIELLTGCPAGEPDAEGNYPEDSVHGRVLAKLRAFNQAAGLPK
ncbi:MAG: ATP-binding protein [Eubacterium sp.]|nr:ATP-binding protein [Eubacterium sp.]